MTNNLTPNVLKATEAIIRQAGDILLEYYRKPLEHTVKDSYGSFVTDADLASEKFLIKNLGPLIPGAAFFAEESGSQGSDSDYCWVIDPLDGTSNFSRSFDYFCISVALTY
ncbi:MAG: inositol monophosphatase family protein, partial [Candidatus Babeliales bacterium]